MATIYDFSVKTSSGDLKNLSDFKNKVLLIVNTASKCGFTKQYKDLQFLYAKYNNRGFEILAFPCDQFANQEFDNDNEIQQFCSLNFDAKFHIFAKIKVNGQNADPLFSYLVNQKSGFITKDIKWNFTKFLISKNGIVYDRYSPTTNPMKLEKDIVSLLDEKI